METAIEIEFTCFAMGFDTEGDRGSLSDLQIRGYSKVTPISYECPGTGCGKCEAVACFKTRDMRRSNENSAPLIRKVVFGHPRRPGNLKVRLIRSRDGSKPHTYPCSEPEWS